MYFDGDDDEELEETSWDDELQAAVCDADLFGVGFFVVFQDGTMGRATMPEVCDLVDEWRAKVPKS